METAFSAARMTALPYRKTVAVFVVNADGLVLGCERSDRAGAWQIPQGGIEAGEDALTAMFRELEEEIGTRAVSVIDALETPIRYDWPEHLLSRGFSGQEQYYFLVELQPSVAIDLSLATAGEFQNTRWMTAEEFLGCASGFKAAAYRQALQLFQERQQGRVR